MEATGSVDSSESRQGEGNRTVNLREVPQRWVVERTFGWMGHNRRLSKDYERIIVSSEATIKFANIALLL